MPIKISLQQHTPEQLYDFLLKKIGPVHMMIKNDTGYITFEKEEHYDAVREKYQGVDICGKRAYWQKYHLQNGLEVDDHDEHDVPAGEFRPNNEVEKVIYEAKVMMIEKAEEMFRAGIQKAHQKVEQLYEAVEEEDIRRREIVALSEGLKKKLSKMCDTLSGNITKLGSYMQSFSSQPTQIDLELTYSSSSGWRFPQIDLQNFQFECSMEYRSLQPYPIKRLAPINGKDWVATAKDSNSDKGTIRFHHVDFPDCRDCFEVNDGAYGLQIAHNIVFAGTYSSTLNYINLNEDKLGVENSGQLAGFTTRSLILQVRKIPNINELYLSTLSRDHCVRTYEVSNDEIQTGINSLGFTKKDEIATKAEPLTIEFLSDREMLLGGKRFIHKFDLVKKTVSEIRFHADAWKMKTLRQHPCVVACTSARKVELLDMRCNAVVQAFPDVKREIRCIDTIPNHTIIYGAEKEMGMLDDRKASSMLWRNTQFHVGSITDISKLEEKVISADSKGSIFSWKAHHY